MSARRASRKRVLLIFGTRPEAVKLAPLYAELQRRGARPSVCVTGQHREMLDQVLSVFGIRRDYDLRIMRPAQDLYDVTALALTGLRDVLSEARPDWVVVQGDTTSTLAGALAAFYAGIPTAHVEAGLRTNDPRHPFPEEINRRLTSQVAALHFAPTVAARRNLRAEGIAATAIHVTGNTVIDALLTVRKRFRARWPPPTGMRPIAPGQRMILVTGHRRESFGAGFERICRALRRIARRGDVEIVYPVHLNPNVQGPVHRLLGGLANVQLIAPQAYVPFVGLMESSYLILTDSGGIQEEAPSLGKPVLVMREVTERPEAVRAGTARLVGTSISTIVDSVEALLDDRRAYQRMARAHNPYGDGRASQRIARVLLR